MAKLKITFRKEVEIDLNAYYPSFSKGLREQIDDAVYGLLGGGQRAQAKTQAKKLSTARVKFSQIFRRTKKKSLSIHTKSGALLAELDRKEAKEFLRDDLLKMAEQHKLALSSVLHNLVANGYIEPVE
jgi:hypothetical protein